MTDSNNNLYWYQDVIELVVTTKSVYVDNRPMNNRRLKAHKGVTNEILFKIRNRDRKLQNVAGYELCIEMIHPTTRRKVFTKILEDTCDVGKVLLSLDPADLESVDCGLYYVYITRAKGNGVTTPIYTDQDNNMRFELEVTDQIAAEPIPSQETDNFVQSGNTQIGDAANTFVSNTLCGNQERNFINAQHTMAIYLDSYVGNIKVQASCLNTQPGTDDDSTDWFTIETISNSDANVDVITSNFVVNCNWVRIVSIPDEGSVERIILRN